MRTLPLLFFAILGLSILNACDDQQRTASKPSSAGGTLEMIVIADEDIWNGLPGKQVKEYFGQDQPGLGQVEPMFDIRYLSPEKFLGSEMFQKHRSILRLKIDPQKKAESAYKKDVKAKPQYYVEIVAPNNEELIALIKQEQEKIRNVFHRGEQRRIIKAYSARSINQNDLAKQIEDSLKLSMVVPQGYQIGILRDDFLWLRKEPAKMSLGILIYTEDYTDTMQFIPDEILVNRDSVTKVNVPGPRKGTYMAVEPIYRPFTRDISFNGEFAVEIRGLWKTVNYQMGGPFVHITTYDKKNQRLVHMSGFVYHPNKEKRNYLMQLEGIIHSINFTDEEKQEEDSKVNKK